MAHWMDPAQSNRTVRCTVMAVLMLTVAATVPAHADGKMGIYGIYLSPHNTDAKTLSGSGFGVGVHLVYPFSELDNLLAVTGGFEWVGMDSEKSDIVNDFGLEATREINQNMVRLFLGGEIGPHGRGFLRPHVGMNLAGAVYRVRGEIIVPDDLSNNSATQILFDEYNSHFGFDTTLGVDFNFTKFVVDVGVRYIKTFGQVQQLQNALVDVHPDYFQVYLGIGIGSDQFTQPPQPPAPEEEEAMPPSGEWFR